MTNDRHRAAAREWLESEPGIRLPRMGNADVSLAALLARVESEAVAKAVEERDRLASQLADAEKIIAAACALHDMLDPLSINPTQERVWSQEYRDLRAAVDAYRRARV